jgi:hypothetical protein
MNRIRHLPNSRAAEAIRPTSKSSTALTDLAAIQSASAKVYALGQ